MLVYQKEKETTQNTEKTKPKKQNSQIFGV